MVFAEESAKEAAKGAKDKEDPKEKDGTTEGDANKMTTVKPHVGSAEGSVPFPPPAAAAATATTTTTDDTSASTGARASLTADATETTSLTLTSASAAAAAIQRPLPPPPPPPMGGAFRVPGPGAGARIGSASYNGDIGTAPTETETAGADANPDEEDPENLLSATLVTEEDVINAERAPEGFRAIVENKRFKFVAAGFLAVLSIVVVSTSIVLPKKLKQNEGRLHCGSADILQQDYTGTMSTTIASKTCLPWEGEGVKHNAHGSALMKTNLERNCCRNPDGSPGGVQAPSRNTNRLQLPHTHSHAHSPTHPHRWCYVDEPGASTTTREHCEAPCCDAEKESVFAPNTTCGTIEQKQDDCRGSVAIAATGKECQRWDKQEPHAHSREKALYPNAGLEQNFCRNPDGEAAA